MQSTRSINNIDFPICKDEITIQDFSVTQNGFNVLEYDSGNPIDIKICFEIHKDLTAFRMGVLLRSSFNEPIFLSSIADWQPELETIKKSRYICLGQIPPNLIAAGSYTIELHSGIFGVKNYGFEDSTKIQLILRSPLTYNSAHIGEQTLGSIIMNPEWKLQAI